MPPSNLRVLHDPKIDPDVVRHAERLLQEAKAGRIRSLCIVGSYMNERSVFRVTVRRGDVFSMIGALDWAKTLFHEDIEPG